MKSRERKIKKEIDFLLLFFEFNIYFNTEYMSEENFFSSITSLLKIYDLTNYFNSYQ